MNSSMGKNRNFLQFIFFRVGIRQGDGLGSELGLWRVHFDAQFGLGC